MTGRRSPAAAPERLLRRRGCACAAGICAGLLPALAGAECFSAAELALVQETRFASADCQTYLDEDADPAYGYEVCQQGSDFLLHHIRPGLNASYLVEMGQATAMISGRYVSDGSGEGPGAGAGEGSFIYYTARRDHLALCGEAEATRFALSPVLSVIADLRAMLPVPDPYAPEEPPETPADVPADAPVAD